MKRLATILLMLVIALPLHARDEHIRPYTEGMTAVESGDWATVEAKMREAISFQAEEDKSIRTRAGLIPYVPHFWLGVALTNQERWDAAIAAFDTSEKQGVIQQTTHFARLRSTRSRIESREAVSRSTAGLDEARQLADQALQNAYKAQGQATAAGASRLTEFRQGNQKLQEALAARGEGTTEGFRKAAGASTQAIQFFESAVAKASAQPSGVKVQRRQPAPQPPPVVEREPEPVEPRGTPAPERVPVREPEQVEIVTAERSEPERRVESAEPELPPTPQASPPQRAPGSTAQSPDADLVAAYRLMASGDLRRATAMFSSLIIANPEWVDALVLRGYSRFLEGVLYRDERMITAAKSDFRQALALDPGLTLDGRTFSPKAIELLESVRSE